MQDLTTSEVSDRQTGPSTLKPVSGKTRGTSFRYYRLREPQRRHPVSTGCPASAAGAELEAERCGKPPEADMTFGAPSLAFTSNTFLVSF